MFADTVQHVFLSPLYALAKYFENRGGCHATRDSDVDFAGEAGEENTM